MGESQGRPEPWAPAIADNLFCHFLRPLFDLRGGGRVSGRRYGGSRGLILERSEEARAMATSHGRRHSNSHILSDRFDLKGEGRVSGVESKDDGMRKYFKTLVIIIIIIIIVILIFGATLGQEPRNQLHSRGESQVEAHGKGFMGLAAAATDKGKARCFGVLRRG